MSDKSLVSKAHRAIALLKQLEGSTHAKSMFKLSAKEDPIQTKAILLEAAKVLDSMAEALRLFEEPIEEIPVDQAKLFKAHTANGHIIHQDIKGAVSHMRVGSVRECDVYSDPTKMFIVKVNQQSELDEKFRFVGSRKEALMMKVLHNV